MESVDAKLALGEAGVSNAMESIDDHVDQVERRLRTEEKRDTSMRG